MPDSNPAHAFSLEYLLKIPVPTEPADFAEFWQARYQHSVSLDPAPQLQPSLLAHPDFDCFDLSYYSTDQFQIGGWLIAPKHQPINRGVVVGHGYGGREGPDFHLPISDAVMVFPCFRGIARSRHPTIPEPPNLHVLSNIQNRDDYIIGGCVADLWLAVSAVSQLFPQTIGHIGYLGISFGGGLGALACAWDARIQRAHFNVPSFGNQPLRLQLPTLGSAAALQNAQQGNFNLLDTLSYYDAATAAKHIQIPVHIAAALADPVVTPPGQFSIYNALNCSKQLLVLNQGHGEYPEQAQQEHSLLTELEAFFRTL